MSIRKHLVISTFFQDGTRPVRKTYGAARGQALHRCGILELLRARMAETESFFPGRHFLVVRLRDGNFNLCGTDGGGLRMEDDSGAGRP